MGKLITVTLIPLIPQISLIILYLFPNTKKFIYQEQLLKAQDEAKKKKLGIWSL